MGVGGAAELLVEVDSDTLLLDAMKWAKCRHLGVRILGGGSNIVVADAGVHELVLAMRTRGVSREERPDQVLVTAKAGESWDDFVGQCVDDNLGGLECLSGIPGTVGATPIQNVGAYGQEVSDTINSVHVHEAETGQVLKLDRTQCGFAYRDSIFKRDSRQRYSILSVTFALKKDFVAPPSYPSLLEALSGAEPTLRQIRDTVLELRRRRSMVYSTDDQSSHSCGSFFTNPIVHASEADEVRARSGSSPPCWPTHDGLVKLSAAWLIERAGFVRGTRRGRVGLSRHHSLALVNLGRATASEVVSLASEIQNGVQSKFGIWLQAEPQLWGAAPFECQLSAGSASRLSTTA